MEETKTITLRAPVVLGSGGAAQSYERLELREPTAGELEQAAGIANPVASNIALISAVCGIPKAAVGKVPAREFQEAVSFLAGFTGGAAEAASST